jgi:hypothetical protein
MSATDVLGWVGAVGVLVAYGLLTIGRWQSSTLPYQATNAVCAGALLVWAISIRGWQSALLNAVWMLVGIVGIVRALRSTPAPEPHVGD